MIVVSIELVRELSLALESPAGTRTLLEDVQASHARGDVTWRRMIIAETERKRRIVRARRRKRIAG